MNGADINDTADLVIEAVALWLADVMPHRRLHFASERETLLVELREGGWKTKLCAAEGVAARDRSKE